MVNFFVYMFFTYSSAGRPIICNIQPIKALLTWLTETEYENHDQQERLNRQIELNHSFLTPKLNIFLDGFNI